MLDELTPHEILLVADQPQDVRLRIFVIKTLLSAYGANIKDLGQDIMFNPAAVKYLLDYLHGYALTGNIPSSFQPKDKVS